MPRLAVSDALRSGALTPVLENYGSRELTVAVVYLAGKQRSRKVGSFVDFLVQELPAQARLSLRSATRRPRCRATRPVGQRVQAAIDRARRESTTGNLSRTGAFTATERLVADLSAPASPGSNKDHLTIQRVACFAAC